MTKLRAIFDGNMKVLAYIPHGIVLVDFGRETYDGIPVPMSPERAEGDARSIETLFDRFPDPAARKDFLRQLHGISRKHAILSIWGDDAHLMDAGSRNGVSIRGHPDRKLNPGEKYALKNGDVFTLGAWPLLYLDDPADMERMEKTASGLYRMANLPPDP